MVISYNSLGGRYIREDAFLSLVRHGLIGPYAKTTQAFAALIGELVKNNHAIVGAIVRKQGTVPRRRGKAKTRVDIEDTGETDL